jgi:serine phosphatase RsbU (regulator of sigma subunit)
MFHTRTQKTIQYKKEFKIYKNDPDNQKSLMSNKCWALLKDDNDILWIGSDVGLQKITSKRPAIEVIRRNNRNSKSSFKGNIITSVQASETQNNIVFAGIDGEGFSIYNRLQKQSINYGPNSENKNDERFVNQFIEEPNSDLYVLGQNNFQKVSFSSGAPVIKSYFSYQEHYSACGIDDPQNVNKLWIGGRSEIYYFDKQSQQFTFFKNPLQITNVFYSVFIANGQVYFGHKDGLLKVNPETRELEKIDLPSLGNIKSALPLNDGSVILSSQFFGLIKYFPGTNKYEIINKSKNEYFSEPFYLFLYKNKIWFTTTDGLTSLNPATGEISEISTDDGLPSGIVHEADVHDGYFYLATQEGLVIINPDFQMSHFISPKVDVTGVLVLTDSKLFGNLKNESEIILTEKQNSFKINFTVLDFNLPEKNRFKFRLSPIENEWQAPVGENFVIFNSLPAGSYKLELLGANADQIWSVDPFVINIKIIPPFYKTTWFYYLCLSILIISGVTFFYFRLRSNQLKQQMLEKIIKERTAEIQFQKAELVDSITYAERIQKAIFVGENILSASLPESFIYYKPKDKVSGDFYWIGKYKDLLIIFAGDCTGHGVPGAMLSIVGTSLLNKIVHEEHIFLPGEILTRLNYLFYNQLSLKSDNIRDGMDASVITVNLTNKVSYFSAAKLDAVCIVNNNLVDLRAQRHSIGESDKTEFMTQSIPYEPGRFIYLFSDGVKDQYGGPHKKKLSAKRFKEILVLAAGLPITEQKQFISRHINDWKEGFPQTDDMIIIGLKF